MTNAPRVIADATGYLALGATEAIWPSPDNALRLGGGHSVSALSLLSG